MRAATVTTEPVVEEVLAGIASGLATSVTGAELPPAAGGSRRYVRLLQTPAYDAWLIEWSPGSDLDLHDHGGSAGSFHVVEGVLVEQHTEVGRSQQLETMAFGPGNVRVVSPATAHRVWNPGPLRALSVHVYSPPLASMTYYSTEPDTYLQPLETRRVDSGTLEPAVA